jgi:hypothetical protein
MKQLFKANVVYLALLDIKSNMIHFLQYGDDLTPMKWARTNQDHIEGNHC